MKSKQTEDYMETLDREYGVIANMRILSELLDIRNWIIKEVSKLEYKSLDEFEYCSVSSRLDTLKEMEEIINNRIKHNSIKE
tara:strand:+ start:3464 stop:3709 length:246 start_codon:yes stop_codon:yes gene_type:complete